ncbi:MAG: diphthine--ammonia ligase [Acidobacteria bacterium]|nr:MAG: diphthine--ammonia ligase [Acidobacteriota bacterium]
MAESVVVSWSGGKDSALALERVVRGGEFRVASLLTTVAEGLERVQIQNVRRELIERQALALGLPLRCVYIRKGASNAEYEERLGVALADFGAAGVRRVAFGDLFLGDIREYRERLLARLGMKGLYPLWGVDTRGLLEEFVGRGFKAVVTSVYARVLDDSFAGAEVDREFLERLPKGVDPCGENGEFHTFVYDGPSFNRPVSFARGELTMEEDFHFRDLLPV